MSIFELSSDKIAFNWKKDRFSDYCTELRFLAKGYAFLLVLQGLRVYTALDITIRKHTI